MVYLQEYCLELLKDDGNLTLDSPAASDEQINTKQKMLEEYEQKTGKIGKRHLSRIPLWYFLHEILRVEQCQKLVCWEDERNFVFTIKKPKELAVLWGQIKNKETMTYPKLARGIRYYYGKGVIEKYHGKRFSYQFIISKKTKAVLTSKENNNSTDHIKIEENTQTLKRKYNSYQVPRFSKRRYSSSTSTEDSSEWFSLSGCSSSSSDEDERRFYSGSNDISSLDACLAEIFSDAQKMKEIFSDDSDCWYKDSTTYQSTQNIEEIPLSTTVTSEFDVFEGLFSKAIKTEPVDFPSVNADKPVNCVKIKHSNSYSEPVDVEQDKDSPLTTLTSRQLSDFSLLQKIMNDEYTPSMNLDTF